MYRVWDFWRVSSLALFFSRENDTRRERRNTERMSETKIQNSSRTKVLFETFAFWLSNFILPLLSELVRFQSSMCFSKPLLRCVLLWYIKKKKEIQNSDITRRPVSRYRNRTLQVHRRTLYFLKWKGKCDRNLPSEKRLQRTGGSLAVCESQLKALLRVLLFINRSCARSSRNFVLQDSKP